MGFLSDIMLHNAQMMDKTCWNCAVMLYIKWIFLAIFNYRCMHLFLGIVTDPRYWLLDMPFKTDHVTYYWMWQWTMVKDRQYIPQNI